MDRLHQSGEFTPEEIEHARDGVRRLKELLDTPAFWTASRMNAARFLEDQKSAVLKKIEDKKRELLQSCLALEEARFVELAQEQKGAVFADANAAKKALQKEAKLLMDRARQEVREEDPTVEVGGVAVRFGFAEEEALHQARALFDLEMARLEGEIRGVDFAVADQLQALQESIPEHGRDARFARALNYWGRSPNVAGEFGEDGRGFHAGIEHFFSYRSDKGKSGRFFDSDSGRHSIGQEPTIESFIAFSEGLMECMRNPVPGENPRVAKSVLIEDELGQRRLMLLTTDGLFLNGFQRAGQDMKLITAITQDPKQFDKNVDAEVNPKKETKRLNSLGSSRRVVPWS